jgi:hypothetical protein
MFQDSIEIHDDVCFSTPNIKSLFEFYGMWQGLYNFRCKKGDSYPIKFLKKVEGKLFANCIIFDLFHDDKYTTEQYIKKTIEFPNLYGKGEILLELHNLLDMVTKQPPADLKIRKHNFYSVECSQYFGAVIVKDFISCPYYIFEQNNGNHIILSHDHIKQLNQNEKKILGISHL